MHPSDDTQASHPVKRQDIPLRRPAGQISYAKLNRGRRGTGCLVWGAVGITGIFLVGMIVAGSVFAGWNSGIALARDNATRTTAADLEQQCDRIRMDMAAGNTRLVQRRIEFLQTHTPACLIELVPTATALYLASLPSATPMPTRTAAALPPPLAASTARPEATLAAADSSAYDYDMDALLAEAEADMRSQNYQAAIDTLDAIIAIDEDFQRTRVGALYFEALTAQALLLFRSGKLAEGIVMTARAEAYGDIQGLDLNYERIIAELYLDAQRLKITNPAESVRLFSHIVYEQGLSNYLNGLVITDLQEAHRNYGDALSWQGDYCQAQAQYTAVLDLSAFSSRIHRANVTAQRNQAAQACSGAPTTQPLAAVSPDAGESAAAPMRPTIVPVGQTG